MPAPLLVSFAVAKEHLRVNHDAEDARILMLCEMASSIALNYMGQYERTEFQTLPVYDPDAVVVTPTVTPWPWVWTWGQPYWWSGSAWTSGRPSYQQLPPYMVPTWLGEAGSPSIPVDIPGEIRAAVLLIISNIYDSPQEDPISAGVKSLLHRWRDPAMA